MNSETYPGYEHKPTNTPIELGDREPEESEEIRP